jgi:hypothetical protein
MIPQNTFSVKKSQKLDFITGASLPPRQPRQLPWLILDTLINCKNWPKQLGRFEGKNIFLPSKKTP